MPDPASPAELDPAIDALLDAIFGRYSYDFRPYARASIRRRVQATLAHLRLDSVADLQTAVLADSRVFTVLLQHITVPVTEMFRDPRYFAALRERVLPVLGTYASLRVWIAGCSTGEEVYSIAILLHEAELLDRTLIYATDINPTSLAAAERGVYEMTRIPEFTRNYQQAGGIRSLADYYTAAYGGAAFHKSLRSRITFSDHSLATDHVFAEVQLVSCRNVLIYFNRVLQNRAIGLFREALVPLGYLGLGARETLRFSDHAAAFDEVAPGQRLYRRMR